MINSRLSLANHLLIATPSLDLPYFEHAVIYVCEHHTEGTVGLIINRPMQQGLNLVFEQLQIQPLRSDKNKTPLLLGGPLQPERGFVIHRPCGTWQSSLALQPDVTITTSNDIIRAIAQDRGPENALVVLGYVGWLEHQLEDEIMHDAWIVCPFKAELIYDVPYADRWEAAGMSIGVNMNQFTFGAGHA